MIKLAIDAMSGDLGSPVVIKACEQFIKDFPDTSLVICGKAEDLSPVQNVPQIETVVCSEVISMNDSIITIRRKKDASMNVAVSRAAKDCDAVVSCGSTAGFYASAMFYMPRLEGVEKCALLATMPTKNGKGVSLCDAGANASSTPEQLRTFAIMGSCYVAAVRQIASPKVALLNIGAEEKKGDELRKTTYQLLKKEPSINFVGNIEGREILEGDVDVIVADGFSGNIALKTVEGAGKVLIDMLKEALYSSFRSKMGALLAKPALASLKEKFDYKSVGGAFMAGFVKPVVKAHGASDEKAFYNAMKLARDMVSQDSIGKMKASLNRHEAS